MQMCLKRKKRSKMTKDEAERKLFFSIKCQLQYANENHAKKGHHGKRINDSNAME